MPRVRKGSARHQKHKKVMKAVRGHRGFTTSRYNLAISQVIRAGVYAYRDRRNRKRDFRGLWIARLSAACEERGTRYSAFMGALKKAGIALNRKMLSEIAIADPKMFDRLVEAAQNAA
jgi:large subunit ribosomal protein L20